MEGLDDDDDNNNNGMKALGICYRYMFLDKKFQSSLGDNEKL